MTMTDDCRTLLLPADDHEAIRLLRTELRLARRRLNAKERAALIEAFRAMPFGGTDLSGR